MKIVRFTRIVEDNAIVAGDGAPAATSSDTTSVANTNSSLQGLFKLEKMAKNQVTKKGKYVFRDNKLVKKRKKKFQAKKFKAPDHIKGAGCHGSDSGE